MHFVVNFLFVFGAIFGKRASGQIILYEDMKDLNISCYPMVNCIHVRQNDESPAIFKYKPCSCNRMCSQFNTCCLDAPGDRSKQTKVKPACREVKLSFFELDYFMIDKCSYGGKGVSVWEHLCNEERAAEDDLMCLVPVTSLFTARTYKNYFCFRCYERTDDFVYWNVRLRNKESQDLGPETKRDQLTYSKEHKSWMIRLAKNESFEHLMPVEWYFRIPPEIDNLQVSCIPDLVSNCSSSWSDESVRQKCHSYMSYTEIKKDSQVMKYRNPHCAACNFEDLSRMTCDSSSRIPGTNYDGSFGDPDDEKTLFSFTHLLDINTSDGDKVGKIKKCENNFLWDPWAKKCRELSCAIPGYTVQGQKCVPP